MPITCSDNRDKIINAAKQDILKATNIEDSPAEMAVLDNFLFRCYQMGWLNGYVKPTTDTSLHERFNY